MSNIYEINNELNSIMDALEALDPASPPEAIDAIMKQYEKASDAMSTKVKHICQYIATTEGEVNTIDIEIERLTALKKSKQRRINNLKSLIDFIMQAQGIEKLETDIFTVKYNKNAPVLKIVDEVKLLHLLPSHLRSYNIIRTPSQESVDLLRSQGFEVAEAIGNKKEVFDWYKELSDDDKKAIAEFVTTEQTQRLSIK